MPTHSTELNTFLTQTVLKDRSRVLLSLAPPVKHNLPMSRLFALVEYPPWPRLKETLPIILNQMLRHYEEEIKENLENAFEHNLEWTNRLLSQMLSKDELSKLHFLFGGIKNNQLQFAYNGQISGHIIFKDGDKYRHVDLIKTYGEHQKDGGIFFANLISGDLSPDNIVIFCTAPVFDFLTIDRLEKILLSRPMEEACRYLEKTLNQIESQMSFGGLIINLLTKNSQKQIQLASTEKVTPDNSIRRLVRKERETENILSPSLWLMFKNFWGKSKSDQDADLETIKKITKIYNRLTGWQGQLKQIWRVFIKFFSRLNRSRNSGPAGARIGRTLTKKLWQTGRAKFLMLSPTRRYLFLGAVIIGAIFIVSVSWTYGQNNRRLEQEKYNQLLNGIKEKIDQADSIIIYNNEERARRLLVDIRNDLAGFPQNSANRREMRQKLLASAELIAAKLRHLETIAPTLAADLSVLNLACQPTDLIAAKSSFFFFCRNYKNLWQYDLKNKIAAALTSPLLGELNDKLIKKDGLILLLNGKNRLTQFDPKTNEFSSLEATWPKVDSEVKLIGDYNTNLYSLDVKNNLIAKHKESTTGFGKGANWLKEDISVSDVAAWTIDGSIYLARLNGAVLKLDSGREQNFSLSALDPLLNSAVKIFSAPDSANFFILDPGQKRVIIWNKKTQKLAAQYTAEEFSDLKDFSVDEKDKTIYLLNGMKIQSIKY